MQLHELQRTTGQRKQKRVGRGRGSGKGKTSGRGTKGQKARAGHKMWPAIREQLKKLPKMRGRGTHGLRSIKVKPAVINVATLEKFFAAGDTINPTVLLERSLIRGVGGKAPKVKILGDGELSKKLTLAGCTVSEAAKAKIEKAGGSISK